MDDLDASFRTLEGQLTLALLRRAASQIIASTDKPDLIQSWLNIFKNLLHIEDPKK